jgi:hypothetical protein
LDGARSAEVEGVPADTDVSSNDASDHASPDQSILRCTGIPDAFGGRRPAEHADSDRLKSRAAIPRREFVPRDPCRTNQHWRCMPRWQASASVLLAAAAARSERSAISGVRSREAPAERIGNALRLAFT